MKTSVRLPYLKPEEMNPEQRALYDTIAGNMGGGAPTAHIWKLEAGELNGPFNGMVHFPEIGAELYALQRKIMRQGAISRKSFEILVLVVVSRAKAVYGMYAHNKLGKAAGLTQEQIDALLSGKTPGDLNAEEELVYEIASALVKGGSVPEGLYNRAKELWGDKKYMAVISGVGMFQFIGTILNAFDEEAPE